MEIKREPVKPSVWNLIERRVAPLWVPDDREDVILAKIQAEEAQEREHAKAKPHYQIGSMGDVCKLLTLKHKEPSLDKGAAKTKEKNSQEQEQQQETGLKKLTFVEMEDYPGFTESSSGLPQKIETASVLRLVTKAIKMLEKPGLLKEWKQFFFSPESQDIVQDLFWWFFLKRFQKPPQESETFMFERALQEQTTALFNRVAHTYTRLLNFTFRYTNREKLLLQYPNAVAQAVYAAYCHAFPASWRRYNDSFKTEVLETVCLWMTGTRPMVRHWLYWDYPSLEPTNMRKDSIEKDANKQKPKDKGIESILTFPSRTSIDKTSPVERRASGVGPVEHSNTSLGSNKSNPLLKLMVGAAIKKRAQEKAIDRALETLDLPSILGSVSPSHPRIGGAVNKYGGNYRNANSKARRTKIESHPAEAGPDFTLTKFDLSGHSPLVEHCLREQKIARDVGVSTLLSRKEITRYPSLDGPTYQQLIQESRQRVKTMSGQIAKYWADCERTHLKNMSEHASTRADYLARAERLLENNAVVTKLAEMIVMDRVYNTSGTAANITSAIETLLLEQDEEDAKNLHHSQH